jgi:hypothetical protein
MGIAKFSKKFAFNIHEGCRSVRRTKVGCMVQGKIEAESMWRTVVEYAKSCIELKAKYVYQKLHLTIPQLILSWRQRV